MASNPTALIILNPVAGLVNVKVITSLIEGRFHSEGWSTRIHLTKPNEDYTALIKKEAVRGLDLVVAAGGDGTIAAVAGALAAQPDSTRSYPHWHLERHRTPLPHLPQSPASHRYHHRQAQDPPHGLDEDR